MAFDPSAPALDGSGIFGLPHTAEDASVVVLPVPWEPTTSYRGGTSRGPAAVLSASRQVDLHDIETGRPYESGIVLLPEDGEVRAWNEAALAAARPVIEAGEVAGRPDLQAGCDEVNLLSARLNRWVEAEVGAWLERGKLVALLGGDHSVSLGAIRAVSRRHPGLGVLQVDAHADLRVAYEGFTCSHASIMDNVLREVPEVGKLVQVGIRDFGEDEWDAIRAAPERIHTFFDAELQAERFEGRSFADQCAHIVSLLPSAVYVSFDIDGLDPALCPHTGTPVPGGLSFAEACFLMRAVVRSGRRIVGVDLVEVAPGSDGDDWDANVAARLLYKMIGWMLRSRTP